METATRRQALAGLAVAVLAVAGVAVFSPARVLGAVAGLGDRPLAFAALLVVCYTLRPLVLWPISALSLLVGFVLGPLVGVPVGLAGAVYTSLPPYLLARYLPGEGGPLARVRRFGRELTATTGDLRGLVGARMLPLPADPVSYGAGLSGIPLPTFVAGTALGECLWVLAAVVAGSSMRAFTLAESGATLPLLVAASALGVLLLGGPAYRRLRGASLTR
jgi:uncharacterized membrane protein YdjX (TVP38/TMEM64 family)